MAEQKYDLVILGAGASGMTASIYGVRYGLKTLVIGRDIGGTANLAHWVENFPGFIGTGKKLMKRFYNHAKNQGAGFLDEDIIEISKQKDLFHITTSSKKIISKALILALGRQMRKLNIPGEEKFLGRGVSYCATCDAFFFKNKNVAVIGGGDSACKAALLLSGIAKKVYLVHRGMKEKCEPALLKKLRQRKNVESLNNSSPFEIRGDEKVRELVIVMGSNKIPREVKLIVDGVFIEIGGIPVSDIAKIFGVELDEHGHVIVDPEMRTNVSGIFAAGDVVRSKLKQIIVAASQGAIAAKSAYDYIIEKKDKNEY